VKSENRFSDYRVVEGVRFPFLFVETAIDTGKELNRLTVQSMTVNPVLDGASFGPPQYARTPLQQFLEQLYMERTDPAAVLNTYREFSRANPGVDTREGVEFIGYQMAKMSDFNGAVELLTANAEAHPTSASAQYGLGRAYQGASDTEHARAAFQRALELDPKYKKASDGLNALR
jgi:tetratricopeptide (TPR) repeat protein